MTSPISARDYVGQQTPRNAVVDNMHIWREVAALGLSAASHPKIMGGSILAFGTVDVFQNFPTENQEKSQRMHENSVVVWHCSPAGHQTLILGLNVTSGLLRNPQVQGGGLGIRAPLYEVLPFRSCAASILSLWSLPGVYRWQQSANQLFDPEALFLACLSCSGPLLPS